ncbi:MAG: DNA polymerase III alpha subunit [uncultured Truepera sp.]|uniref:Error-prone DNA polymerase n=1 Tax=uncultured Truepera sp. TaxID=543023 RepID=A0A6J4UUU8_9DEIN|nr:MAG: DNA polymerase III alpha subunit [uncultured Truepera sp.]
MRLPALLNCYSYFSFGQGVSSPTRLVERAAELGYGALALTDVNGVYGAVEAQKAGKKYGVKVLVGATVTLTVEDEGYPLVLIAQNRSGYEVLCNLLTAVHGSEDKVVSVPMLLAHTQGLVCLTGGRQGFPTRLLTQRKIIQAETLLETLKGAFSERLYLQLYFGGYPEDLVRARKLRDFAHCPNRGVPVVAAPEVRYATPDLYPLYDTLVCSRLGITVRDSHQDRPQNMCSAVPDPHAWETLPQHPLPFPEGVQNAEAIVQNCNLELLAERLTPPAARIPEGTTVKQHLDERLYGALADKYGADTFMVAKARLETELVTMKALGLSEFFLVAAEVTDFCKRRGIVASGRGSAAASVVCYLLGITGTDPVRHNLLFERFLHTGRTSLPDVDIDIGSSRRDEVLAWVEERFGASTEAMVCNKITYRLPLAVQDLGRGLGIPPILRNTLSKKLGRDYRNLRPHRAREATGVFDDALKGAPVKEVLLRLLESMEKGFVRHISPHSGGVVLSRHPLSHYSPLERSTGGIRLLQFDKDDAESLGLIKLDLLGLRMLGVFERCREEVLRTEGTWLTLTDLPDDPDVWKGIQHGDTMGLFQVESPAQTRITVDMRPQSFLDLAHQVALIRPGPIQSGTVHPYVRRRKGLEPVTYLHPCLEPILEKSYGVLLFQEDVMRVAVQIGGFSWNDAERFRKAVGSYEEEAEIDAEKCRFIAGAQQKTGLSEEAATRIFDLCASFRGYGFAESHAWAFGQHAYTSAWLRHHYPAEYFAAVLTEDPGMWPRSTLMQEARCRGVGFSRVHINLSGLHYQVGRNEDGSKSVRVPLTSILAVSEKVARQVVLERLARGPYGGVKDLYERLTIDRDTLEALARAGAFDGLQERRDALYQIGALVHTQPPAVQPMLSALPETPPLPELSVREQVAWDYRLKGLNEWGVHPVDLIRQQLLALGATPMVRLPHHGSVTTAGVVVARQRPPTAKGFAFYVIEDGPLRMQVVISPNLWARERDLLREARIMIVSGRLEKRGKAWTIRADQLVDVHGDAALNETEV